MELIGPISQLVTLQDLPLRGPISDNDLVVISNAGIAIENGTIVAVDNWDSLLTSFPNANIHVLDGAYVAVPGYIDCHTHICFGGNRARDFALRNAGVSYLEIAQSGGGIWDTVTQTRKCTEQELTQIVIKNANKHLQLGVTTIEVKSGYGLSVEEEIKMLRAINRGNNETAADIVATCLAAHLKPKDFNGSNEAYLDYLVTNLFPVLQSENLTKRIDAFIETSAFSASEIAPYLQSAKELGFDITIHADQFTTGGSEVAVQYGAISADHLEASEDKEIEALANSNTIAVALPGASVGLGCAFAPARKILDKGGALAIASDWNPGSAPMGDLVCQASILATFEKLSNAEVLAGITFRAAAALNLFDRGTLIAGNKADFILYSTTDYRDILYYQGSLRPTKIWKSGKLVSA
ncbi:MAG: imidazolonepropionase [Bacteroidetes bacterium]|nr:imidazolonepropionase [Bacteroidota bacterium]